MREQNSSASTSTQERQTDAAHLDLLKHDIPESWYPSPEAQKLVGVLEVDVDREKGDAIDHAYRSLKILSTFCKTLDPERRLAMADAMLLHDIPGRTLHRETDERAKLSDRVQEGWKEYIAQLEDSDKSVIDYMHDQVVIGTEARDYREAIKHQSNGISAHDKEQIMDSSYEGMVNVAGWRMGMPEIRGTALEKLAGEVNIESLVIKAAEISRIHPSRIHSSCAIFLKQNHFIVHFWKRLVMTRWLQKWPAPVTSIDCVGKGAKTSSTKPLKRIVRMPKKTQQNWRCRCLVCLKSQK